MERGLSVIGVDISYVAVHRARSAHPNLMAVVSDLQYFRIPPGEFDLIINFLYLQRDLWQPMSAGLRKDGLLFVECLTDAMLSVNPDINPDYLLKPGELQQAFQHAESGRNLEILYYSEGWQATPTSRPKSVASLIARRHG